MPRPVAIVSTARISLISSNSAVTPAGYKIVLLPTNARFEGGPGGGGLDVVGDRRDSPRCDVDGASCGILTTARAAAPWAGGGFMQQRAGRRGGWVGAAL